jgi:zinc/manganese transport system permease protein
LPDFAAFLVYPFLAAVVFVGIHAWFGLQVLRRKVIFADLALAQLSALGATLATLLGHAPASSAGFGYALLFTGFGAALLTVSRRFASAVLPEAFVGILYVVATAATVLVVDQAPQGAEHVKRMLVGNILTIGPAQVLRLTVIYAGVGFVQFAARRPLLALARDAPAGSCTPGRVASWDFVFYASFAVVVTSSVASAGVLLVFCFLIIPAVIGTLFSQRIGVALGIAWAAGITASAGGFVASVTFDLPTGAATVLAFAFVLLGAGLGHWLFAGSAAIRAEHRRTAARSAAAVICAAIFAGSLWLVAFPSADQPLIALLETTGFEPRSFLTAGERAAFDEAAAMEQRYRGEIERLTMTERRARWQDEGLSDEQVLSFGSFQQSFNEMGRGERFVQDHLRALARERARWWLGLPPALAAALGLMWLNFGRSMRSVSGLMLRATRVKTAAWTREDD